MEEDLLIEYQEGSFSNSTSDNQTNLLTYCRFDFYPFFLRIYFHFCHFLLHLLSQKAQLTPVTTAEQQEAEDVL